MSSGVTLEHQLRNAHGVMLLRKALYQPQDGS